MACILNTAPRDHYEIKKGIIGLTWGITSRPVHIKTQFNLSVSRKESKTNNLYVVILFSSAEIFWKQLWLQTIRRQTLVQNFPSPMQTYLRHHDKLSIYRTRGKCFVKVKRYLWFTKLTYINILHIKAFLFGRKQRQYGAIVQRIKCTKAKRCAITYFPLVLYAE